MQAGADGYRPQTEPDYEPEPSECPALPGPCLTIDPPPEPSEAGGDPPEPSLGLLSALPPVAPDEDPKHDAHENNEIDLDNSGKWPDEVGEEKASVASQPPPLAPAVGVPPPLAPAEPPPKLRGDSSGISGGASSSTSSAGPAPKVGIGGSGPSVGIKGRVIEMDGEPPDAFAIPMTPEKDALADTLDSTLQDLPDGSFKNQMEFMRENSKLIKGSKSYWPLRIYARRLTQCPCTIISVYVLCIIVFVVLNIRPIVLETDFSAFIRADGDALRNSDAFKGALEVMKGVNGRRLREAPSVHGTVRERHVGSSSTLPRARGLRPRRLNETEDSSPADERRRRTSQREWNTYWLKRELIIMYKANSGNVLDEPVLREIRALESALIGLPKWSHFCKDLAYSPNWVWLCQPGESFIPFAWPTRLRPTKSDSSRVFDLRFDGGGSDVLPFPVAAQYMDDHFKKHGDGTREAVRFFPKGFEPLAYANNDPDAIAPKVLKSRFTFIMGFGYRGWTLSAVKAKQKELGDALEKFIQRDVYSFLTDFKREHCSIYFTGAYIDDHEVSQTLFRDIMWSIGSIVFVTLCMYWHMQSIVVSLACFCIVFGSVIVAYVLTPAERTTLASFSSIFLITVIDIDVIFVFVGFWEQSQDLRTLEDRIVWMMVHAGKSCLATSVTTSVSFFANMASCLQPLREFGLLMGLCVMAVYVLAILILPPLMVLEDGRNKRSQEKRRKREERAKLKEFSVVGGSSVVPSEALAITDAGHSPGVGDKVPLEMQQHRRDETRARRKKGRVFIMLFRLISWVRRWSCLVFLVTICVLPGFIAGIISRVKMDTGVPQLFPDAHNQIEGKRLYKEDFKAVTSLKGMSLPQATGSACSASHLSPEESEDPLAEIPCVFQWCEANPAKQSDPSRGSCFRGPTMHTGQDGVKRSIGFDTASCLEVEVFNRVARAERPDDEAWTEMWSSVLRREISHSAISRRRRWYVSEKLETLVLEDWDTGTAKMSNFYQAVEATAYWNTSAPSTANLTCRIETMCFFGTPTCQLRGWKSLGEHTLPQPTPTLDESPPPPPDEERRLATSLSEIHVVFGLLAPESSPMVGAPDWRWKFDPMFEPQNPWAQRAILAMCTNHPQNLYVRKTVCWVENFKLWLYDKHGSRFPTRRFDDDVVTWYIQSPDKYKKQLWFQDRKVKACQMVLSVALRKGAIASSVLKYKKNVDEFVNVNNADASLTANRAFHTSSRWVSAEAEVAIVSSTVNTILIELVVGWLCIFVFTGDPVLALIVLSLVVINISGLAFFMIFIMNWLVGPIEVICLVVFVGYSVTFGLHVVHNYAQASPRDASYRDNKKFAKQWEEMGSIWKASRAAPPGEDDGAVTSESEDPLPPRDVSRCCSCCRRNPEAAEIRLGRTRVAVLAVGGAIMNAAVSTIGSSIFLLLCTLSIFQKIGAVVIIVTVLSVIVTLISLPAVLILVGPGLDPCYKRYPRRLFLRISGRKKS